MFAGFVQQVRWAVRCSCPHRWKGLVQERHNPSALAIELRLSCIDPTMSMSVRPSRTSIHPSKHPSVRSEVSGHYLKQFSYNWLQTLPVCFLLSEYSPGGLKWVKFEISWHLLKKFSFRWLQTLHAISKNDLFYRLVAIVLSLTGFKMDHIWGFQE